MQFSRDAEQGSRSSLHRSAASPLGRATPDSSESVPVPVPAPTNSRFRITSFLASCAPAQWWGKNRGDSSAATSPSASPEAGLPNTPQKRKREDGMPGLGLADAGGPSWSPIRQGGATASPPADPAEEKAIVTRLNDEASDNLEEGDAFKLVSFRWWKQWKEYLGEGADEEEWANKTSDFDSTMFDAFSGSSAATPPSASAAAAPRPPPMDNTPLIEAIVDGGPASAGSANPALLAEAEGTGWRLQRNLQEEGDYVLVPANVWEKLHSWYGGGPEITRHVIMSGRRGQLGVEVYPLTLHLRLSSAPSISKSVVLSKKATVEQLVEKAKALLNCSAKIRLWDLYGGKKQKLLEDLTQCLDDAELQMDNEILVEEALPTGNWPQDANGVSPSQDSAELGGPLADYGAQAGSAVPSGPASNKQADGAALLSSANATVRAGASSSLELVPAGPASGASEAQAGLAMGDGLAGEPSGSSSGTSMALRSGQRQHQLLGLTGLVNLGNTCFMNSALQCLVHTPPLVGYFRSNYSQEINTTNPLGMEGELAMSFGELLRKLWAPGNEPVPPRAFKARLSRFAPQFSGYNQHDSQELLAFLLDGLHEDLNRVHRKPYIEAKDSNGRPDEVVAAEYWANHKARNDSIIVDTCQGQYKSTLVCPVCAKVSVTFDPFMYLSLPLPSKATRSMTLTVISSDGSKGPCTISVSVLKGGTVTDLMRSLATEHPINANQQFLIAEIYQSKLYKTLPPHESLSGIADSDKLLAYIIPKDCSNPVVVNQRIRNPSAAGLYSSMTVVGAPLVLPLPRVSIETGQALYDLVRRTLRPFRTEKAVEVKAHDSGMNGTAPPALLDAKGKGEMKEESSDEQMAEPGPVQDGVGGGVAELSTPASDSAASPMEVTPETASPAADVLHKVEADESRGPGAGTEEASLAADTSLGGSGFAAPQTQAAAPGRAAQPKASATGFRLKVAASDKPNQSVELYETPEPLPQDFLIAGTLNKELQPLLLDWVPRTQGQIYNMRALDELPSVGSSQGFWGSMASRLPYVGSKTREGVTLYACLDTFLKEEPLGPDDMWYCPTCKEHRQATKKLDLWRLPEILVVHLKRFSYSRYFKNKLDTFVDFPLRNLDLTPYIKTSTTTTAAPAGAEQAAKQDSVTMDTGDAGMGAASIGANAASGKGPEQSKERYMYDLYAVSNHFGGMGGGHYTAFAKHPSDGRWYCFDDSFVSSTTESQVKSSAAYVLFYQRRRDQ